MMSLCSEMFLVMLFVEMCVVLLGSEMCVVICIVRSINYVSDCVLKATHMCNFCMRMYVYVCIFVDDVRG